MLFGYLARSFCVSMLSDNRKIVGNENFVRKKQNKKTFNHRQTHSDSRQIHVDMGNFETCLRLHDHWSMNIEGKEFHFDFCGEKRPNQNRIASNWKSLNHVYFLQVFSLCVCVAESSFIRFAGLRTMKLLIGLLLVCFAATIRCECNSDSCDRRGNICVCS